VKKGAWEKRGRKAASPQLAKERPRGKEKKSKSGNKNSIERKRDSAKGKGEDSTGLKAQQKRG